MVIEKLFAPLSAALIVEPGVLLVMVIV